MKKVSTMMFLMTLLFASTLSADDKDDLMAAMMKSFQADSYRVRMTGDGRNAEVAVMEFQKPDRFRVITDEAEMIAVDGSVHMVMNGQIMQIPMDVSRLVEGFRGGESIGEEQDNITITAVERETLNGEATTRYDFTMDEPGIRNRAWIAEESGYLTRMEQTTGSGRRQSTTTMDYEDFGKVEVRVPSDSR